MDEHGPHVDWRLLEKLLETKYPKNINKSKIPHYL
jgi:hypothetical protein